MLISNLLSFIYSVYKGVPQNKTKILISYINVWLIVVRKFKGKNSIITGSSLHMTKNSRENCPIKLLCSVIATCIYAKIINHNVPCMLAHIHDQDYAYSYPYYNVLLFLKRNSMGKFLLHFLLLMYTHILKH